MAGRNHRNCFRGNGRREIAGVLGGLVLCLCVAASGSAQPAVTLDPGFGRLRHPVSTKNELAQQFFDQGLALIYGFNHEEARRSFEQAARLDPKLAMAHWGIALAVGPNYNESQIDPSRLLAADRALERAGELAASATEKEQAYIAALARRYQTVTDLKKCAVEYKEAMGALARRYPDDSDAAVLYADALMNLTPWQLWSKDGQPAANTREIVATLEAVLKRDPEHIGANHLYIHAVEASRDAGRALPSADRLAQLAPAAGHLVHMPSHIYIRTGANEAAARSNEAAAEADRAYIKRTGATGMYPAMYYSHNLHFALEAYNRMGAYKRAREKAAQLEANVRGHIGHMPMLEGFLPSVLFVELRFNRWDEVLAVAEPAPDAPVTRVMWRFARGVAFAARGKLAEAERERAQFAALAGRTPGETVFGLNSAASVFRIAEHSLNARIAEAKRDSRTAIGHWRQAVAALDALNYDEPPGWFYPVRESLGAALLLAGKAADAENVFREDLLRNPRNGRSLFGLAESLMKQGKTDEARSATKEFEAAWNHADTKLRIEDL
jgi:tetratricopeptide (TPR) repeat protein